MMKCPAVELDEDIDPRDFVLSQNKARRHLTKSQLGMATTEVYEWVAPHRPKKADAPAEQAPKTAEKKDQAGESTNKADLKSPLLVGPADMELPFAKQSAKTEAELAAMAGVNERTIRRAKTVIKNASPEVVDAVKSGRIGLPKAVAISRLPREEQAAAISRPVKPKQPREPKKFKRSIEPAVPPEFELTADDRLRELNDVIEALQEENQRLADRLAVYEWAPHARPRKTEDHAGKSTNKSDPRSDLLTTPKTGESPATKQAAKTAAELAAKAGVDESTIKQPPAKQAPCQRR